MRARLFNESVFTEVVAKGELVITMSDREKTADTNEGSRPSYCPECGEKTSPETKFCPKCGADLRVTVKPSATRPRETVSKPPDILGIVSAGVTLIIIAIAYIQNPFGFSVITDYFQRMGSQGAFIKPPMVLLDGAIFFFYAAGVWGIALSALRMVLERSGKKALGDLVGALCAFFVAFLLTNYAADVYTGRTTLAYFIIAIGLLVIVNTIIHFALPEKKKVKAHSP